MVERVRLEGPVELELPDGGVVRVQPGPYRKGISVVPIRHAAGDGEPRSSRGRRPRAGTILLRERLRRDVQAGHVARARDYVRWLLQKDPTISLAVARQVVYRERRTALAND